MCVFITAAGHWRGGGAVLMGLLSLLLTGDRRGRGECCR